MKKHISASSVKMKKSSEIVKMFDEIVPIYDFLNHFLSFGFDYVWRKKAVRKFSPGINNGKVLDLCSGTGDLAFALLKRQNFKGEVIILDGSMPMLIKARKRIENRGKRERIKILQGDAENLPLIDSSINGVMMSFGIRNLPDARKNLDEIFRVLNFGGELRILEFSTPKNRVVKILFGLYFKRVLPFLGGLVSKQKSAYSYLVSSVYRFSRTFDIYAELRKKGFEDVKKEMLTMGIVSIYSAKKG
jgi:demethylmenaquinone methyltransferase/2-methoxy-6-polyprenyl-1,4-benzoquinol methylase